MVAVVNFGPHIRGAGDHWMEGGRDLSSTKILIINIDFEDKNIDLKNIENRQDQSCNIDYFLAIEKFNLMKILIERLKIFNLGCLGSGLFSL